MLNFGVLDPQIVLVDDEVSVLDAYSFLLESMGVTRIVKISDSRTVMETVKHLEFPILFLDLNMPHKSGQEVLEELREQMPYIPVIICTANSELEMAVECLKRGAHDYLVKPINMNTFGSALRNALEIGSLRKEVLSLKGMSFAEGLQHPEAFQHIVTQNRTMLGVFHYIEAVAASGQPALILGETGVGKEMIARALHDVSGLKGEFVAVDVSGLDDTLFSDTLFGHEKGAYTGADKPRMGLIERAAGGTLFLDEIGDLSEVSQVKLLRLLQEGIYYPLGSDKPKQMKARIVTAANKRQDELAGHGGRFRQDLYYRLSTHLLKLPPLRERKEDIPLLITRLAAEAAEKMNKPVPQFARGAINLLTRHGFPGNVRELKTYVYDAVARCMHGEVDESLFTDRMLGTDCPEAPTAQKTTRLEQIFGHFPTLTELSDYAVETALSITEGNQSRAAQLLGVSKQALNKRLKK